MPEDSQIYRKVAMDRLSSPEQLDQLMHVTSSKGWVALVSLAVILTVSVVWGVFGSIHTKVNGRGILIKGGHVYDVVSIGSGEVTEILVEAGDPVTTNTPVALISQPELDLRISATKSNLSQLAHQHQSLIIRETNTLAIEIKSMVQEYDNLLVTITNYDVLLEKLDLKLAQQQEAFDSGLIPRDRLLATDIDIFNAKQDKARAWQRLRQIEASRISRPTEVEQIQTARQQKIDETEQNLKLLIQQRELTSKIFSTHVGTALEILVDSGSYVTAGQRVLSLETPAKLEAVIYTPPEQGKRIKTNYQVQLSPATVKREEAGFIKATVLRVSPFPSTPERMMRVLRNQDLVKQLSGVGAPIEVLVSMETNDVGQYIWSSTRKPPEISSGTLCSATFLIETNRPIALVLPILKKNLGL